MTKLYNDFQVMVNDIESRKNQAEAEEKRLIIAIQQNNEAFDLAELSGESTKTLSEEISDLQGKLNQVQRTARALDKKPGVIATFLSNDPTISGIAAEILQKNKASISDLKEKYERESDNLNRIKKDYLEAVSSLGQLHREAGEFANECNLVRKYVKGQEKSYISGIGNEINAFKDGLLYVRIRDLEQKYKGVK